MLNEKMKEYNFEVLSWTDLNIGKIAISTTVTIWVVFMIVMILTDIRVLKNSDRTFQKTWFRDFKDKQEYKVRDLFFLIMMLPVWIIEGSAYLIYKVIYMVISFIWMLVVMAMNITLFTKKGADR